MNIDSDHGKSTDNGSPISIAEIWADMRQRRAKGDRIKAEHYLDEVFLKRACEDEVVDVIYSEFVLDEEEGREPKVEEFVRRYQRWGDPVRKQLCLHAALTCEPSDDAAATTLPSPNKQAAQGSLKCPGAFGRYLLVSLLDSGSQGEVYRAVHPELHHEIVIKISRPRPLMDLASGERLLKEARLLADISHPNLARVYDAGVEGGRTFLVLEYVRGINLAQFARQHHPTVEKSVELVARVAEALSVVHASGVLHLDVKPNNIVIDEQGRPRLLDFGLARVISAWHEDAEGSVAGTIAFMAPEQASGDTPHLGPPADVFALGGVLYFLLTGESLYRARTLAQGLEQARECQWNQEALDQPSIPQRLRDACTKALSRDPGQRFHDTSSFAAAIQQSIRPRGRWRLAFAFILAGCLGAGWLGWSYFTSSPAGTAQPSLAVRAWRGERYVNLIHSVPLRTGDQLQITVNSPPDRWAALFLVTSDGRIRELERFPPQAGTTEIHYPGDTSRAAPLEGQPGSEFILFCTTRDEPPTARELERLLAIDLPWPRLPDFSVLRIKPDSVHSEATGRDFGPSSERPDPEGTVRKSLEKLRIYLVDRDCTFEGLAFSHNE